MAHKNILLERSFTRANTRQWGSWVPKLELGRTTFVNAAQHVMVFDIDPGRAAKMAKTA